MQSHWYAYADRALNSPFFLRSLALQKLGMPAPHDPPVRHFPYIDDLGRLASLLALPPWQEPIVQDGGGAANPETVETYRQRIGRIVALYTNGLGTVEAMRRMTEAQLPVDVDATPEQQDRPFGIEEFAALTTATLAVELPGQPTDYVGPLMHWPRRERRPAAVVADRLRHLRRAPTSSRRSTPTATRSSRRRSRRCSSSTAAARSGSASPTRDTVPPEQDAADPAGARLVARGGRGRPDRVGGAGRGSDRAGPVEGVDGRPGRPGPGPAEDRRERALGGARHRRALALRRRLDDRADRPARDPLPRRGRPRPAARDRRPRSSACRASPTAPSRRLPAPATGAPSTRC